MTLPIGNYFLDRDQPELQQEELDTIARFHDLHYRRWMRGSDTVNLSWFGHHLWKCPLDLWIYQELIVRTRPDVIIETGTYTGGSALYLASIFDLLGKGAVMTIDIEARAGRPSHPRISYLEGSSIDPAIIRRASEFVGDARAMVILDSDHRESHVLEEIVAYAPLVKLGDYLIVEDTNINGHPTYPEFGPGPMEAVASFLSRSDEFEQDERCERFMLTFNPRGYLRRVNAGSSLASDRIL
jgi:cephalosporin hydroxylase